MLTLLFLAAFALAYCMVLAALLLRLAAARYASDSDPAAAEAADGARRGAETRGTRRAA